MMDNFTQILQRQPMAVTKKSSIGIHFASATPFKVQVNFYIPLFEGQIDADALEKWLNLLEGYFFVQNFFDREKFTFALLKAPPMSNISGKIIGSKVPQRCLEYMGLIPLRIFLWMQSRNNITLLVTITTST